MEGEAVRSLVSIRYHVYEQRNLYRVHWESSDASIAGWDSATAWGVG